MGQLGRAIATIAATVVFTGPCTAKIVKFDIVKTKSPACEGSTFGADTIVMRAV
jgi:hypothetical protein